MALRSMTVQGYGEIRRRLTEGRQLHCSSRRACRGVRPASLRIVHTLTHGSRLNPVEIYVFLLKRSDLR